MTRRIVQIISTLDRGGAEKQLALLATGLPREEFEVHVCALTGGGPYEQELVRGGIPVAAMGKRWKFDPVCWWKLRDYLVRLRPALAHTWMFTANSYGRTAAVSAKVPRIVASERCVDSWKAWHQLAIDRRLARSTDAIVVNGRGVEQFYREQGIPAGKLRLITNGIGPAPPSDVTHDELCRELGLPAEARLIGAVGRLWHQKRIKDVIWAADLLKVTRKDVHLLIIGEGPQREALERFRELCLIEDQVHFLGARSDVMRLMPHFDLLWLASSFEGLPNVIMEAMSAGVPVVATDIWGNRELVVHGETGFLVPVGDRAGLARCAYKILEDGELRKRLGETGRRRILAEFSVETMVARHAALYRELLG
jgi:glycosyltransferase involved in cell wall biosynthesis